MKIPRWIHKLYAKQFGYFWKSCPICGEYFGGHEIHPPYFMLHKSAVAGIVVGELVCTKQKCKDEALRLNRINQRLSYYG